MAEETYWNNRTLWFEFLISPMLLEKHLAQENPDPSPEELIVNFLSNSSGSGWTNGGDQDALNSLQPGFPHATIISRTEIKADDSSNKRKMALKLLALKVAAFLQWDLDKFEKSLPLTMQYLLLTELIKFCEKSSKSCDCCPFAYILYYRWVLKSIIKVSYPIRGQKGFTIPIPLLQQIDPTFVPHEIMESLVKKLHEVSPNAISNIENFVLDYESGTIDSRITIPSMASFGVVGESITCNWEKMEQVEVESLVNLVRYELGRWFFFSENYVKAKKYWSSVEASYRNKFPNFEDYLSTATSMVDETNTVPYEIQDSQEHFQTSLNTIVDGGSADIFAIERKLELKTITEELVTTSSLVKADDQKAASLRKLTVYLCAKINGLEEQLAEKNEEDICKSQIQENVSQMAVEEGEIDAEEEPEKDPETILLEATDPEIIHNLATKVQNLPLVINKRWEIPRPHSVCLQHLQKPQYCKCHIVLAKADELRRAKLYMESRTLYLSLLEDIQASLPNLASLITLELLQTDLEHHFDNTDVDERRNLELMTKCERALLNEAALYQFSTTVVDLCCIFLLEAGAPFVKDFVNSPNPILKFIACLACVSQDPSGLNRSKDLWEFVLSSVCKRPQPFPNSMTFPMITNFITRLKSPIYVSTVISCLIKMHNLVRDNQHLELSVFTSHQWPPVLGTNVTNISLQNISILLQALIEKGLSLKPNEISLLRCKAELYLIDGKPREALRMFIMLLIIVTEYFTAFGNYCDEEVIIQCMIKCSMNLGCHTQAAVLHQMNREPNYNYIFMALNERTCNDSCDDLYDCFWDVTVLEYLINLHTRRGEVDRRNKAIQMIGQLELNANNTEEICKEAANVRRARFFRMLAKKYL